MSKVPPILLKKLAQLRRRERLVRFAWGAARVAAVALVALLVAGLIDWTVDLWDDTPLALRSALVFSQLVLVALAALGFVLVPQLQRLRDRALALFVEDKRPDLQHRLISALELNQPGAKTEGMSPELLDAVTREAEQQARPIPFAALADHSRLHHGAMLLVPAVAWALFLGLLFPATVWALLQRQLLADVPIPRFVSVEPTAAEVVWPSGEEGAVIVRVKGPGVAAGRSGTLWVWANDGNAFSVPLQLLSATSDEDALYFARVPAGSVDFVYKAKLGDGRMHEAARIRYVPRPNVIQQDAYVILPEYVGLRHGMRFEKAYPGGDVTCIPDTDVRVVVQTQKPVVRAVLETFGSWYADFAERGTTTKQHDARAKALAQLTALTASAGSLGPPPLTALAATAPAYTPCPQPLRRLEVKLAQPAQEVQWVFPLTAAETSYRVVVFDEYGFASKTGTVRALKVEPEPAPSVVLHGEAWEIEAEFKSKNAKLKVYDLGGMPLPISASGKVGKMQISYEAYGPYGLGKAQLRIHVVRGANDSEGEGKKEKIERWGTLPLQETPPDRRLFDKSKGRFYEPLPKEQVFFYAVPVAASKHVPWPRVVGGGSFDYQTAGFIDDATGLPFVFLPGDQVEVWVEVYNRHPDPAKALVGKSKIRDKEIVPVEQFARWLQDTQQEATRIEGLMKLQQQVYDRPWFSLFGLQ
jgi:hypothetical protein